MKHNRKHILEILEECRKRFAFPALDNGYFYLAASRLSVFHSKADWAILVETFGFSPRAGEPYNFVHSFGSSIVRLQSKIDYPDEVSFERYLENNPYNDAYIAYPIESEIERAPENEEIVSPTLKFVTIRGQDIPIPTRSDYERVGIDLIDNENVYVFELCRFIAAEYRTRILASSVELRKNLPADLNLLIQMDEWNHPDILDDEVKLRENETFLQIAIALEKGDSKFCQARTKPNNHWRNWPEAGTL